MIQHAWGSSETIGRGKSDREKGRASPLEEEEEEEEEEEGEEEGGGVVRAAIPSR